MIVPRLFASVAIVFIAVSVKVTTAQDTKEEFVETNQVKIKKKDNVVRMVVKPKAILNRTVVELQTVFAERMRAFSDKNFGILMDQVSPDYTASRPNGSKMNYEDLK